MKTWLCNLLLFYIITLPGEALAYIGPGAGLSAFGSLLALIAAIFLTIIGFIWYPVKRILRRRKTKQEKQESDN